MVILDIPAPDGPDIDAATPVLATCWVLYGIAGSIVAARVYAQARILHQYGWGDAIMILAMLINQPMGIMPATLGRVSLIMLMLHLFGGSIDSCRWILRLLLAQTLLVNIATCITIFTQCERVETLWDPVGVPSICWDRNVQTYIGYFQGACNSATDLILTCMSITLVWTLPLKFRLRLGLSILLGLSGLAFVASVVKTIELRRLGDRLDFTFSAIPLVLWCSPLLLRIENTIVIVAGSVPLLRSSSHEKR
ncbi:hypothetical protein B0J14DRAFT_641906 [Halenospora varia]|nr:hypothetical protein B0J14DRAFT_641906 [Halenospora varia]